MIDKFNKVHETGARAHRCISSLTLRNIINHINVGVGHDIVHSLVLKHSCDNFIDNIVLFLNTIFIHNFIPLDVLKGDIIPILKDKKGNISDSGNYRPIMQSFCLLKIIEIFMLDFLRNLILIVDNLDF